MSRLQKVKGLFTSPAEYDYEDSQVDMVYDDDYEDEPFAEVAPLHPELQNDSQRIHTVSPREFVDSELQPICQPVREGSAVILNLSFASDQMVQRLTDFAFGLAAGVNGRVIKITDLVYLIAPPHVSVEGALGRK